MRMIQLLQGINLLVGVLLAAGYFYQIIYLLIGLVRRRPRPDTAPVRQHRYAALVCARNEEAVISGLIQSLNRQDYPRRLLDVYVLADNCTDSTAQAARRAGATVFERFDRERVGKGYALDFLFKRLSGQSYAGYFVFDADNLVDPGFVREMNRVFDRGYPVVTSYRNSRNFGANWITAGYSIWFLREARFLNHPRMLLGNSCAISGTGFLVSDAIIRENGGWPFHLLTEDIQFSVDCALRGRKIGYCDSAVVYDEQPTSFRQSFDQRLRWSKGFLQIDAQYLCPLVRGALRARGRRMVCYDMLMTVAPASLVSLAGSAAVLGIAALCLSQPAALAAGILRQVCRQFLFALVLGYAGLLLCGALTVASEWDRIREPAVRKLIYLPLFPIFIATYLPITLIALVRKVEWKPIRHTGGLSRRAKPAHSAALPAGRRQ